MGSEEIDEPYGNIVTRRPDVLVVPESTALEFIPRELAEGQAQAAVGERHQADTDAQAFFRSALNNSLGGYEVVFVAGPQLPDWAEMLGAQPVQVHASVGNRQWILRRSDP